MFKARKVNILRKITGHLKFDGSNMSPPIPTPHGAAVGNSDCFRITSITDLSHERHTYTLQLIYAAAALRFTSFCGFVQVHQLFIQLFSCNTFEALYALKHTDGGTGWL